ncbi:hypothetical protein [Polaromonas sp. CG9_12]|uniref:hypothetical protein n=1 Tax=Polaromonas sp. CG_9.11 TaxID=2787730 RepID=UPI0004DDD224|nr:hypothetical protein [Polaromonas sp. CG_9.11]MBG6076291.1 hypothetical protein [Polaromonas sp. CG_9.11]CDS49256.1 hypothetical protein [Polaromonas sp. CG9_12]
MDWMAALLGFILCDFVFASMRHVAGAASPEASMNCGRAPDLALNQKWNKLVYLPNPELWTLNLKP